MIRAFGGLILGEVAGIARDAESLVNTTRMALSASGAGVLSGQRERGLRCVIEACWGPRRRRVAELAILREAGGGMVWIAGRLIVLQVA